MKGPALFWAGSRAPPKCALFLDCKDAYGTSGCFVSFQPPDGGVAPHRKLQGALAHLSPLQLPRKPAAFPSGGTYPKEGSHC